MALANWMTALEVPRLQEEFLQVGGLFAEHSKAQRARMRCLTAGTGPSLLLLHGLLGTADAWSAVAERLAVTSAVSAPDALGIGGSDRVPGLDVSLTATAARLIDLMDQRGVARADVVGTSHGGSVALMLAALYPERVRSLILHAPANPFSDIADPLIRFYRTTLGRWFADRLADVPAGVQALALGRMYGDTSRVRSGSLERYIASLRVPGTISYILSILNRWEQDMAALKEVLPQLRRVPALLVWGDRDRAVSLRSGERLANCFDHASLVVIPGAGHLPHEELPTAFASIVGGFLAGRDRRESNSQNGLRIVKRNDVA